jgi:hypothetical protein
MNMQCGQDGWENLRKMPSDQDTYEYAVLPDGWEMGYSVHNGNDKTL